jgi:hypothetical protein
MGFRVFARISALPVAGAIFATNDVKERTRRPAPT